jgi:hypothetical protein
MRLAGVTRAGKRGAEQNVCGLDTGLVDSINNAWTK